MVDGSKVTSMILMVIIGLVIIIFAGIVIWKYRQDQLLLQSLVAQGSLTQAQLQQFPSAIWTYGLAAIQIILGLVLIIWGVGQYFATSKHVEAVKEYVSRPFAATAVAPAMVPAVDIVPVSLNTDPKVFTGGSRRMNRM